jgi:hypothetical protein
MFALLERVHATSCRQGPTESPPYTAKDYFAPGSTRMPGFGRFLITGSESRPRKTLQAAPMRNCRPLAQRLARPHRFPQSTGRDCRRHLNGAEEVLQRATFFSGMTDEGVPSFRILLLHLLHDAISRQAKRSYFFVSGGCFASNARKRLPLDRS